MAEALIVDLFAGGPAGWDLGARSLGLDPIGLERWSPAVATRAALGLRTIQTDVAAYPASAFAGRLEGLIASPPCPDWSKAGKRATVNGASGALVCEVIRWAVEARPTWIAAEQVDTVLPVWRAFAGQLRRLGYRCWTGLLDAADYGVPQNRVRAFLLAHAGGLPHPPLATHAERPAVALDGGLLDPWITMAEALDLDGVMDQRCDCPPRDAGRPAPTVTGAAGGESQWVLRTNHRTGSERGVRYERAGGRPAPTVDGEASKWSVRTGSRSKVSRRGGEGGTYAPFSKDADRPAPAVLANADRWRLRSTGHSQGRGRPALTRALDRPSPAVYFGHGEADWALLGPGQALPLTLADALVLQGFPADLPVAGDTKRARHLQVGNAVPPALAAAVLEAVIAAGPAGARPRAARGPWVDYLPDLSVFAVPPAVATAPHPSLWPLDETAGG